MTSLIVHAILGILMIAFTMRSNPDIFRRTTPAVSAGTREPDRRTM